MSFENEKSRQTVGLAGSFLFDACLNDVLYIAPAVKDTDDFDTSFVVINQIINCYRRSGLSVNRR